jgi:hypothetical protein
VADLFIAPAANEIAGLQSFLPSAAVEWVQSDPRVKELATFREMPVPWGEKSANLAIIEGSARGELDFVAGPPNARALFHQPGMVAVSESFANRHGTKPGDVLEFSSPKGPAAFQVVGVIKDFTRDSGLVMIDRPNFRQFWSDERLHSPRIFEPLLGARGSFRFIQIPTCAAASWKFSTRPSPSLPSCGPSLWSWRSQASCSRSPHSWSSASAKSVSSVLKVPLVAKCEDSSSPKPP